MISLLYPLKIELDNTVGYYDDKRANDFLIFVVVDVKARRDVRIKCEEQYIIFKSDRSRKRYHVIGSETIILRKGEYRGMNLEFHLGLYTKSEFENSIFNRELIRGKLILGKSRSRYFCMRASKK